jgi:hypothetical protein
MFTKPDLAVLLYPMNLVFGGQCIRTGPNNPEKGCKAHDMQRCISKLITNTVTTSVHLRATTSSAEYAARAIQMSGKVKINIAWLDGRLVKDSPSCPYWKILSQSTDALGFSSQLSQNLKVHQLLCGHRSD